MNSLTILFVIIFFLGSGCSKESQTEKAEVEMNSIKRSVEKSSNRISEAACGALTGDNKAECLSKKIKNRAEESKDTVIDKAKEVKNKLD